MAMENITTNSLITLPPSYSTEGFEALYTGQVYILRYYNFDPQLAQDTIYACRVESVIVADDVSWDVDINAIKNHMKRIGGAHRYVDPKDVNAANRAMIYCYWRSDMGRPWGEAYSMSTRYCTAQQVYLSTMSPHVRRMAVKLLEQD